MIFNKFHEKIMNIEPIIRYAAIQNTQGEIICGGIRERVSKYLSDDEIKMMHQYASQRWNTRKKNWS